jgi:hypothetical protein
MNTVSSKYINATYTAVIFITVFIFVAGCDGGKKAEAEANNVGEKTQADSVKEVRTWNCGDSGSNVIATLKDDTTLIVSGTGATANYGYNECKSCGPLAPWHNVKDRITDVIIEYGVTSIGAYAFSDFICLTSVTIPNSVRKIGHGAFIRCSALTAVTFPNSVASIDMEAFGMTGITSVVIPDSVTHIQAATFAFCKNLTSVTIHERVASIQDLAFAGCTGLTSITIPNRVWTIGMASFENCTNLMSIIILNPRPPYISDMGAFGHIKLDAFGNLDKDKRNIYFANACLYVPASSIAAYRIADGWKDFKRIKPLEFAPAGRK